MKTAFSLFILFFVTTATYGQDFNYSFAETYEVSTPAQLELSSFDGDLEVIPSDGNKIEVFYIVRKGGKLLKVNRKELEEELIVQTENFNDRVRISVRNKDHNRPFNFELSIGVSFKVYVPKETSCTLASSDGGITIGRLNGNQQLKTSDGNIRIAEITGDVRARTSDGDIHVERINGEVDLGTSDGSIDVQMVGGDLHASTSDGNIKLNKVKGDISVKTSDGYIDFKEISGSFRASTSDGNIRGNVINLQKELSLRTSDGDIELTLPDQLGLDLDIKGESIDVPFKNFTGKFDEKHVHGQSNGGGIPVVLTTSGGNVRITH